MISKSSRGASTALMIIHIMSSILATTFLPAIATSPVSTASAACFTTCSSSAACSTTSVTRTCSVFSRPDSTAGATSCFLLLDLLAFVVPVCFSESTSSIDVATSLRTCACAITSSALLLVTFSSNALISFGVLPPLTIFLSTS